MTEQGNSAEPIGFPRSLAQKYCTDPPQEWPGTRSPYVVGFFQGRLEVLQTLCKKGIGEICDDVLNARNPKVLKKS